MKMYNINFLGNTKQNDSMAKSGLPGNILKIYNLKPLLTLHCVIKPV